LTGTKGRFLLPFADFFSLRGHKRGLFVTTCGLFQPWRAQKGAFCYRKWTFLALTGTKEGFLLPQVDFFSIDGNKKGLFVVLAIFTVFGQYKKDKASPLIKANLIFLMQQMITIS
jgi:hypothetical protein